MTDDARRDGSYTEPKDVFKGSIWFENIGSSCVKLLRVTNQS